MISFRIDWFDLLAIQGTLKILFQCHSLKASIFWSSAFFLAQFSHPYKTTGKTIALTIYTFVVKEMFLLSNMLSRLVTAFLLGEHTGAHLFIHFYLLTSTEAMSSQ